MVELAGCRSKENIPKGKHISIFQGKIFGVDTFAYSNLKKNGAEYFDSNLQSGEF